MNKRSLGSTNFEVSEIDLEPGKLGLIGVWKSQLILESLSAAADAGVNFIDTADVYGGAIRKDYWEFIKEEMTRL